jgi:DNA-binding Lrp family transcriptional regulator
VVGSNVELAERVRLTPGRCLRRVKRLQDDGVIVGYTAVIDPVAMGRAFEVLVNVDLTHKDNETVQRFESEVAARDEVTNCAGCSACPTTSCASVPPTWTPPRHS